MRLHRSTDFVIERFYIPATESPSVERDSFILKDEDYRELEHDELSPVWTRKITRTMGGIMISKISSLTGSYQSTPLVVRGEPGGELARRWSWEMSFTLQKVLQGVLALPYWIGRRSAHCWTSSFFWVRRTRQQPNACQQNKENHGNPITSRV